MTKAEALLPLIVEDRAEGGKRTLVDSWNHPFHPVSAVDLVVVSATCAINYIAHGRLEGQSLERPWHMMTPKWQASDEDYEEGCAAAAQRVLERAIRRGEVSVFEATDDEDEDAAYSEGQVLWRIDPEGFAAGVWMQGHSRRGLDDVQIHGLKMRVRNPLFEAEAIKAMADPAEEYADPSNTRDGDSPDEEADEPRQRKRSHTRNYGTPNGTLAARLLAMGRDEALSLTTEPLGAMLAEEFKAAGFKPLNDDTMRQMAGGLRDGLFGLGA